MLDGSKKMAKISKITDADNVLRYARKRHLLWNEETKTIIGCDHELFKLRYGEKNLSVNWVEFFDGKPEEQIKKCIADFAIGFSIKKRDMFAKLNVGKFKGICLSHNAKVRIIHDSKTKSHTSITQLPQDNDLLFDDLCNLAFKNVL